MDGYQERRKKKISLFAKLVISVSFVPVLRCLWMNWGKWLEKTAKQKASQPASLLGNFKPPLQRRLGFSSKGHDFGITALPSHPFSNLEQNRGGLKVGWGAIRGLRTECSVITGSVFYSLWPDLNTYLLSTLEEGFHSERDAARASGSPALGRHFRIINTY